MSKEVKIIIGIAIVVIAGGVLLFVKGNPQPVAPSQPSNGNLLRDNSHMTGTKDAKVTVIEFGDYECPACAAAEPILEKLRADYKDNPNVNFVFRNFPLPQHAKAQTSAEAAEAAAEQGKFWEMHDRLYADQDKWVGPADEKAFFLSVAKDLGLDNNEFQQSWSQNKFSAIIKADQDDGLALGVNATPTIFINGEKTTGYGYDELKAKIEAKLK